MAGEENVLGTARVVLTIDTSSWAAQAATAKNMAHSLGDEAAAAFDKADTRAKRAAGTLIKYAEGINRSTDEQRLYNAQLAGVPTAVLDQVVDKINQQRFATQQSVKAARELEATNAFRTKAEEAQKLVQATNYIRWWEDALEQADATQRRVSQSREFINSLQQQAAAVGKTRSELLQLRAAELGVAKDAQPFINKLREQERALGANTIQFDKYGLSVKQTQAALRQVPAQLTDIVVSLQGGQAPLTVLLQQGGQLRDVFGGAMPALRAIGAQVLRMVNPYTLLAAAVGTVGFAYFQSEKRQQAFLDSLTMTGNRVNRTADDLFDLAQSLDELEGVTEGRAADAINATINSAQFTGEQMERVSRAAVQMQSATGRAIDDTVKEFAKLRNDPVSALIELGTQYGYLTQEMLDNVRALQRQGDEVGAATLAIQYHADVYDQRTPDIVENLGLFSGAWRDVKVAAIEGWDAMVSGIGRFDRDMSKGIDRIKNWRQEIAALWSQGARVTLSQQGVVTTDPAVDGPAPSDLVTPEQARAQEEFRRMQIAALSEEARLQYEINEIERVGRVGKLSELEIAELIAAKEKQAADRKKGRNNDRVIDNAEAKLALQAIKDQQKLEQAEIANSTKLLQAQYGARLVDAEDYYAELRQLVQKDAAVQEAALIAQIDVLRQRKAEGKDAIDVQREIGKVETELAQLRAANGTALAIMDIQSADALNKLAMARESYRQVLERSNQTLERQINAEIAAIGLGQLQAQRQREIAAAYQERDDRLRELQDRLARKDITQDAYDADLAALESSIDERVRLVTEGFQRMDAAKDNWLNGVSAGIANWMDQATDVASQVERIIGNTADATVDLIAESAIQGKFLWRDFLIDILSEITRFMAKQAVVEFLKMMQGNQQSDSGNSGFWGALISGVTGALTGGGGGGTAPVGKSLSAPMYAGVDAGAMVSGARIGNKAMVAGGASTVNIAINTNVAGGSGNATETRATGEDAAAYREFANKMEVVALQTIQREMKPGGTLWRGRNG